MTTAPDTGAHVGNLDADPAKIDDVAERTLRALQLTKQEARGAIRRARARATGPLTVEELVTLVLRGMPSG